jgi:hypothetical protein
MPSRPAVHRDDRIPTASRPDVEFELIEDSRISDAVLEEALALYAAAFPSWPHRDPGWPAIDHLRWKTRSPASPLGLLVGRRDGRLVHACTVRSGRVRVRGRSCLLLHHPDAAVHPSERGRGIYAAALEHVTGRLRPRYDLAFDEIGAHPAMTRVQDRIGSRPLGNPVRNLVRVLHAGRVVTEWLPGCGWPTRLGLRLLATAQGLLEVRSRARLEHPGALGTLERFDARTDALFEAVAPAFDLIGERTSAHLNWRYADRRAGPFEARACEASGALLGYIVLRRSALRWEIADLLALPGRPDVIRALVADALERARAAGAAVVSGWLPRRHPYRSALRQAGFIDARTRAGVLYRPADLPPAELAFLGRPDARIHFTIGDTDLV